MYFVKALLMAIGMFSVLPVPRNHWDERCLPWVIPFFPMVGIVIGAAWYLTAIVSAPLPIPIQATFVLLVPFFLSGFLHVDGYMDTSDAIFSRRSLEEKQRILKDSHVGAFAVIALVCLMLVGFSAVQVIVSEKKTLFGLMFIPVISRCVTGFALLKMKPMSNTGFLAMFRANTQPRHTMFILLILVVTLMAIIFINDNTAVCAVIMVTVTAIITAFYVTRQLQGLSGDLCGCIITVSEMCGLLGMAMVSS